MVLVAIQTKWDKETTEMAFKLEERILLKHKKKLEKINSIPTEGSNKCFFLPNIEDFSKEIKQEDVFRWLCKSRPFDNIIFYTCHNWGSIPKNIRMITDFFFDAILDGNNLSFVIFRQGEWMDKLKKDIGRDYMKTIKATWKDGKLFIKGRNRK